MERRWKRADSASMRHPSSDMIPNPNLRDRAITQMRRNTRSGWDRTHRAHYHYVQPSPGRYKWQWFWDSCFHAIALARIDPDAATRELDSLLAHQRADGFIGHIMFWGRFGRIASALSFQSRRSEWHRAHTAYIQPPLLAQALMAVWRATGDLDLLRKRLPKVNAYYRWLRLNRDVRRDGLIGVISPYETGLDNSPAFDRALGVARPTRPGLLWRNWRLDRQNARRGFDYAESLAQDGFAVIDPFVNAVYSDALDTLSHLYDIVGNHEASDESSKFSAQTLAALNRECWDGNLGRWVQLIGRERKPETTLTVASILPLICSGNDASKVRAVVDRYLTDPRHFGTPFPVPSVAASEPSYDPSGESFIWRGPLCLNLNWLIARGLRRHRLIDEAEWIEAKSHDAASRDFREFYSPETGAGMRGTHFGWATVPLDMPTDTLISN